MDISARRIQQSPQQQTPSAQFKMLPTITSINCIWVNQPRRTHYSKLRQTHIHHNCLVEAATAAILRPYLSLNMEASNCKFRILCQIRMHYQCHQILILVKHRITRNNIIHSRNTRDAVPFLYTNHDLVNRMTQLTAMSKIQHQTNNETANNAIPVKTTNKQNKGNEAAHKQCNAGARSGPEASWMKTVCGIALVVNRSLTLECSCNV